MDEYLFGFAALAVLVCMAAAWLSFKEAVAFVGQHGFGASLAHLVSLIRNPRALFSRAAGTAGIVVAAMILAPLGIGTFISFNYGLGALQDWWHANEIRELETLKARLETLGKTIDETEANLTRMDAELASMERSIGEGREFIEAISANAVGGQLPEPAYTNYTTALQSTNSLIAERNAYVKRRNAELDKNTGLINDYNALIPRANELAQTVGNKWQLAVGRRGRSRAR